MKTLIFILLLAGLLSACHKEQDDPVSADLKAAYSFNIGSYWIYKDSISGETDSQYVYLLTDSRTEVNGQHTSELIGVYMKRTNINIIVDSDTYILMSEDHFIAGHSPYTEIFYPFVNEGSSVQVLNTLSVNNTAYSSIAYVNVDNSAALPTEFCYLDKNIGIIKFQTIYPSGIKKVFELIRYKIVK